MEVLFFHIGWSVPMLGRLHFIILDNNVRIPVGLYRYRCQSTTSISGLLYRLGCIGKRQSYTSMVFTGKEVLSFCIGQCSPVSVSALLYRSVPSCIGQCPPVSVDLYRYDLYRYDLYRYDLYRYDLHGKIT